MDEKTQQAENNPVAETQEPAVPTGEQQTEETKKKVEEPKEGLPEEVKERTKREFDKLQTNLREERTRREYYESLFQQMQPQEQPKFVDPVTGLLDEQALTNLSKQTQEASNRAAQAEKRVLEYQRDQENNAVYAIHPELNPDGKSFNKDLHVLTKSVALQSMVAPDDFGGKQLSFMEAVEYAKKMYKA